MLSQKLSASLIGLFVFLQTKSNAESVVAQSSSNDNDYKNFEMALFQKIAQDTPSNVIISPYSQKILLGMIMDGAVNETSDEIRTALRISSEQNPHPIVSPTQMNRFNGSDGVKIANRIFLDKAYQINEEYRKKLQQDYSADIENVEKGKPKETTETINEWVKNGTSGLIPSIVRESDITSDFVMALGNAIYFKGTWKNEFSPYITQDECFHKNGEEDCVMQEMMGMYPDERFNYGYSEKLDVEVVDLPYEDGKHSMIIVLPKQRNGIGKLIRNIHGYSMQDLTSTLTLKKITLKIPKFTAEYETDTIENLKSLNIRRAFHETAQLDNMITSGGPVKVSKILHKSKILVNEKGSEAAAVSIAMVVGESARYDPEVAIPFTADHPFIYFIKDDKNNALFAGKYTGS